MANGSGLDAIIIADSGIDSLSGTNPLKLRLDDRVADIQVVANYVRHNGRVIPPVEGDDHASWSAAPKLNGIYLYSYLRGRGFTVSLIHNYHREKERFAELLALKPRAVVISTTFIFFKKTLRDLAGDIRAAAPGVCIIAGGSFIHYSHRLLQRSREQDYETAAAADHFLFLRVDDEPDIDLHIVSPRVENTLCDALHRLHRGASLDSLENTARLAGGSYRFGPAGDDIREGIPPEIDWTIVPDDVFAAGVVPVQASNGCPYNCSFCNFTRDRRLSFVKPVDRLVSELRTLARRGARYAWFVDDNFRLGRTDLDDVCRRFIAAKTGLRWMCFIRASALENADLELLRAAGCTEVQIGLESGDPAVLRNMNKNADPVMYRRVVRDVLAHGINVSAYFIAGFPGETPETAEITRKFIRSIECPEAEGALSWSIYPFILSPLAPVYEPAMRERFHLQGYLHNWSHRTMDYRQARQEVVKSFMDLENSGPIYRGDNLDMLEQITPARRKEFYRIRHALARMARQRQPAAAEIIKAFAGLF